MARILLVDDSADVRNIIEKRLSSKGWEVVCCENGHECLEALTRQVFDVLILDLVLPGIPGLDVLAKIRADSVCPKIPVIVITGFVPPESLFRTHSLEVCAVLVKPFSLALLVSKVEEVVSPARKEQLSFDPSVLRIFLEATLHIVSQLSGVSLVAEKPFLKQNNRSFNDFSALLSFSSVVISGSMAVNMGRGLLTKTLVHMLGRDVSELNVDQFALKDCCGEVGNQILGRAKQLFLKQKNLTFDLSVPSVVFGKEHLLNYKASSPVLVIPFKCERDSVYVEFCVENGVPEQSGVEVPESKPVVQEGELLLF